MHTQNTDLQDEANARSLMRTARYKKIRDDLIGQLRLRKADTPAFVDLVGDYMAMWTTKELLARDIRERGTLIEYDNGGGQKGYKSNDSVDKQYKVNAQMLKLLSELNIKSTSILAGDEDEL